MKENKVVVKLHLRYTLHAKLYLAYSNDKRVPVVSFLGSSRVKNTIQKLYRLS